MQAYTCSQKTFPDLPNTFALMSVSKRDGGIDTKKCV